MLSFFKFSYSNYFEESGILSLSSSFEKLNFPNFYVEDLLLTVLKICLKNKTKIMAYLRAYEVQYIHDLHRIFSLDQVCPRRNF